MSEEVLSDGLSIVCSLHSSKWLVSSGHSTDDQLCVQCCQMACNSGVDLQVLDQLVTTLKNGSQWVRTSLSSHHFSHDERVSLLITISGLLYHFHTNTQKTANNCLKLILPQLNDHLMSAIVFDDIIKNVMADQNCLNEWILDLAQHLLPDCVTDGVRPHRLTQQIYNLLNTLRNNYHKYDNRLKQSVLQIYITIYNVFESIELFRFDEQFHSNTLQIVFSAFESQSNCLGDKIVLMYSIDLLKKLSSIDTFVDVIISDHNLLNSLQILLNNESQELKTSLFIWICDVLETESVNRKFANILLNETITLFIALLNESKDPFFSNHLLNCINLILINICRPIGSANASALSKAIIECLMLSVKCKDHKFFINAMTALMQLIKRNPSVELMSEFEFYSVLDMLEDFVVNWDLYIYVVKFLAQFLNISIVPTLIPIEKMNSILTRVLKHISKTTTGDDVEDMNESILRTIGAVDVIKSLLNLINNIKDKDFSPEDHSVYLLNGEPQPYLSEKVVEDKQDVTESVEDCKQTELYSLLSLCLTTIETFFIDCLDRLLKDPELQCNSLLCEKIISCFAVILGNNLYASKEINALVARMFSKGHVLTLIQLLWLSFNTQQFQQSLAIILSHFLFNILENDANNDMLFQPVPTLDREYLEHGFKQLSDIELKQRLERSTETIDTNESMQQFYITYFAAHYYSLKSSSSRLISIDESYDRFFTIILNLYLTRDLNYHQNSIPTVRHSLYLASLTQLGAQTVSSLRKFFGDKNHNFLSIYYTNHINLLKWVFDELKCDNFCEYALREFFEKLPENYDNVEKKDILSSFFQLIHSNHKALQILIQIVSDKMTNVSVINVFDRLLSNADDHMEESDICCNWNLFHNKILENLPHIIVTIVDQLKNTVFNDVNPEEEEKVTKMLDILCRIMTDHLNYCNLQSMHSQIEILITHLLTIIDKNLSNQTIGKILELFGICFNSSSELRLNEQRITQILLDSHLFVILLVNYLNLDSDTDQLNERSLYLLAILNENKCKYKIQHHLEYKMDIKRITKYVNNQNKNITSSAYQLLNKSLNIESYFESSNKSDEEKCDELQQLVHYLMNALFKTHITLAQMTDLLSKIFNGLQQCSSTIALQLYKHLARNPWFQTFIVKRIQTDDIFGEDLFAFQLMFHKMNFINTTLTKSFNQLTERYIGFITDLKVKSNEDNTQTDALIERNIINILKAIDCGVYRKVLNEVLRKRLSDFVEDIDPNKYTTINTSNINSNTFSP